jgi:Response regulator containing CheY-like receiver domain and AraC-type DNA-binding domain
MTDLNKRLTLLCSSPQATIAWESSGKSGSRTVKMPDFRGLETIAFSSKEQRAAIGRIVLDGVLAFPDFLAFLASLPDDSTADVLLIENDKAFLSAATNDGRRVLYGLNEGDLDFYCQINALVTTTRREGWADGVAPGNLKRVQVLVAEDDRKTLEHLQTMVGNLGCEVLVARTGLEAVRIAAEQRPDVIFLDGLMPEMHGFEVARLIRHIDAAYVPRIVMLTGIYKALNYRNEARLRYGIDGYLTKPVAPETMASAVFAEQGQWSLTRVQSARHP